MINLGTISFKGIVFDGGFFYVNNVAKDSAMFGNFLVFVVQEDGYIVLHSEPEDYVLSVEFMLWHNKPWVLNLDVAESTDWSHDPEYLSDPYLYETMKTYSLEYAHELSKLLAEGRRLALFLERKGALKLAHDRWCRVFGENESEATNE